MANQTAPRGREFHNAVLDDLFKDKISADDAARKLASLTLATDTEAGLKGTWETTMIAIRDPSKDLEKLGELLVSMADLPDATDGQGNSIIVSDMKVWSDLPLLGSQFDDECAGLNIPEDGPERVKAIGQFTRVNNLAAWLLRKERPAFASFDIFAIYTMRNSLEQPTEKDLDIYIPAAATWISVIGRDMYDWDKEFPSGGTQGDPGRGGPLWYHQPGFSKDRWRFWKRRLQELSTTNTLSGEIKEIAKRAAKTMDGIERS